MGYELTGSLQTLKLSSYNLKFTPYQFPISLSNLTKSQNTEPQLSPTSYVFSLHFLAPQAAQVPLIAIETQIQTNTSPPNPLQAQGFHRNTLALI